MNLSTDSFRKAITKENKDIIKKIAKGEKVEIPVHNKLYYLLNNGSFNVLVNKDFENTCDSVSFKLQQNSNNQKLNYHFYNITAKHSFLEIKNVDTVDFLTYNFRHNQVTSNPDSNDIDYNKVIELVINNLDKSYEEIKDMSKLLFDINTENAKYFNIKNIYNCLTELAHEFSNKPVEKMKNTLKV